MLSCWHCSEMKRAAAVDTVQLLATEQFLLNKSSVSSLIHLTCLANGKVLPLAISRW